MSQPTVSIHPYFKIHPGKLDLAKASLPEFVERTHGEPACFYYDFSLAGDVLFCREAYRDAEGVLTHLANVDAQIKDLLKIADLERLEIHGPAEEIEKLRVPLAELQPTFFIHQCGVER